MNLLLVDSKIPSLDKFLDGINDTTRTIVYSIDDTFESVANKISTLNISEFANVAFVFVDDYTPLKMFVSYNTFISFNGNTIEENNTTKFIKEIVNKYKIKNLDFLACNLLKYKQWMNYFDYLIKDNIGLIVRASNDRTGNLNAGGDWILESTNEDISKLYFNEKLNNWNELLDSTSTHFGLVDICGNLQMCGANNNGQLGFGDYNGRNIFTKNTNITNALGIASGYNHTIIMKNDGTVWCSGYNYKRQFGIGNNISSNVFIQNNNISSQQKYIKLYNILLFISFYLLFRV